MRLKQQKAEERKEMEAAGITPPPETEKNTDKKKKKWLIKSDKFLHLAFLNITIQTFRFILDIICVTRIVFKKFLNISPFLPQVSTYV